MPEFVPRVPLPQNPATQNQTWQQNQQESSSHYAPGPNPPVQVNKDGQAPPKEENPEMKGGTEGIASRLQPIRPKAVLVPKLALEKTEKNDGLENVESNPEAEADLDLFDFSGPDFNEDAADPTPPNDEDPQAAQNGGGQPFSKPIQPKARPSIGTAPKSGGQDGGMSASKFAGPKFKPSADGSMFDAIKGRRGLGMVEGISQSKAMYGLQAKYDRKEIKGSLPQMMQPTGLPVMATAIGKGAKAGFVPKGKATFKAPKAKSAAAWQIPMLPRNDQDPEDQSWFQQVISKSKWQAKPSMKDDGGKGQTISELNALVKGKYAPQINTQFGTVPRVPMQGESDPALANEGYQKAVLEGRGQMALRNKEASQDFGENDILPQVKPGMMKSKHSFGQAVELDSGIGELPPIMAEHREGLDMDAEHLMRAEVDKAGMEGKQLRETHMQERDDLQAKGMEEIGQEVKETTERQSKAKNAGANLVQTHRQAWMKENDETLSDLEKDGADELEGLYKEMGEISESTNKDVQEEVKKNEFDAKAAEEKARQQVEEKKRQAEEDEKKKSWFDLAVDSLKAVFKKLKDFVHKVFSDLRKWVKQKFENLKKWVVDKIERARKWLVNKVKQFGELMKGMVDIALAAFPETRDKFKAKIDQAVDKTTEVINREAEKLKQFTQKAIDKMAAAVDASLEVMEKATILVLDGLEAIGEGMIRMVEVFYEYLKDLILKIATIVALVGFVAAGFMTGVIWNMLGEESKKMLLEILFDTAIWVFENAPDDMRFGVLWPLFVHGVLGFLYEARDNTTWSQKKAIMDKVSDIVTLKDTDFVWNFVINIFVGIWDNIWGIITGIWDLITFIFKDLWVMLADMKDWIEKVAPDLKELWEGLKTDIKQLVSDFKEKGPDKLQDIFSTKNVKKVIDFFNGMATEMRVKARVMGMRMAHNFREFMLSPMSSAKIGEKLGWLTGNIIVEVLLAVFTVGIGTAIKGGLRVAGWLGRFAQWFSKFGKVGKFVSKIADMLGSGLKWLVNGFQKMVDKFSELGDMLMKKLKGMFASLEKRIDDFMAKLRKKDKGHGDGADGNHHNRDRELDEDEHRRRQDEEDGKKQQDDEDGKKKNDDDDDNAPGAERHEVAMLGNPHFVSIWKGPKARINFDRQNIFMKLQRAKTHETSTEGKKIDNGLAQIKLKSEALVMRARAARGKLGGSSQWREFVQELHEFARRYDANDIDHIADKKDVHVEERFSMNGEPHRIWYDSDASKILMASQLERDLLSKIDDEIQNCDDLISEFGHSPHFANDVKEMMLMKKSLSETKIAYQQDIKSLLADLNNKNITRKKYNGEAFNLLKKLTDKLRGIGMKYRRQDLKRIQVALHFHLIRTHISDLRKHIPPGPNVVGDGHNNSAASAEHFGWSNPNGQHWNRRIIAKKGLEKAIDNIIEIEAKEGGEFKKFAMFKEAERELEDCLLSLRHPRQYLISNRIRMVFDLWKAYFPELSKEEFSKLRQRSSLVVEQDPSEVVLSSIKKGKKQRLGLKDNTKRYTPWKGLN